jgi:hypothetical protein
VFVPAISSFNDPWESSPGFTVSPGHSDPAMAIAAFLLHRHSPGPSPWDQHYADELRDEIDQMGIEAVLARCHDLMLNEMRARCVLCMSARGDVPLQWSYYASGHTGYALCFDSSVKPFVGARPVRYVNRYPNILVDRAYEPRHALDRALLRKACFWRHESEWRVLATKTGGLLERLDPQPRTDVDGVYGRLPVGALKAIILGARMPTAHRFQVRHIAESVSPPIQVVEAKQVRYRFEISLPAL